jgi:hypothetical protein
MSVLGSWWEPVLRGGLRSCQLWRSSSTNTSFTIAMYCTTIRGNASTNLADIDYCAGNIP